MANRTLEDAYAYAAELQSKAAPPVPRYIRRHELKKIVPLANTTIYELEQNNKFPRRFYLTPRAPVWDLKEVEAWIEQRRAESAPCPQSPAPNIRKRKWRPVRKSQ